MGQGTACLLGSDETRSPAEAVPRALPSPVPLQAGPFLPEAGGLPVPEGSSRQPPDRPGEFLTRVSGGIDFKKEGDVVALVGPPGARGPEQRCLGLDVTPGEGHSHQTLVSGPHRACLWKSLQGDLTQDWGPHLEPPARPHLPEQTAPQQSSWACPGSPELVALKGCDGRQAGDPASKLARSPLLWGCRKPWDRTAPGDPRTGLGLGF